MYHETGRGVAKKFMPSTIAGEVRCYQPNLSITMCGNNYMNNQSGTEAGRRPRGRSPAVYLEVFGCQMNKLDAEIALEALRNRGYRRTASPEEADAALFFTCAVRQHAEDRFFSHLGRSKFWKKRNPQLKVVVAGCIAEHHGPEIIRRYPYVDIVCGTRNFPRLPDLIRQRREAGGVVATGDRVVSFTRTGNLGPIPQQAYLNVMRGCSLRCSYCIVPDVRGPAVSRPPEEIVEEAQTLVSGGVKEITLLGQTINYYGRDRGASPGSSLGAVLRELGKMNGLSRIHLVTSHPRFMDDALIDAIAEVPAACEGLHMPAQSGSNRILKAMRRGYTSENYLEMIDKCRSRIPGFEASGDFIVGFPGETEEDFELTVELIRKVDYQNLFIFKYSPRPGTSAAELPDDVPVSVKKERNRRLLEVQEAISLKKNRRLVGSEVEVLNTGPSPRNRETHAGRTRTGRIVIYPPTEPVGDIFPVKIDDATPLALYGTIVRSIEKEARNG